MFERTKKNLPEYRGIVAMVNVPYFVSKPTHNKQQFADSSEQRNLILALSEYMDCYYRDLNISLGKNFWCEFGYLTSYKDLPLDDRIPEKGDKAYLKARLYKVNPLNQCCKCFKWRKLGFRPSVLNKETFKEDWCCADNEEDENLYVCQYFDKFISNS
jgi:hypothetical protein